MGAGTPAYEERPDPPPDKPALVPDGADHHHNHDYSLKTQDEKAMFSMITRPRVRYDVEVVTKLIIYSGMSLLVFLNALRLLQKQVIAGSPGFFSAGIGWISVEATPILFHYVGLGLES